MRDKAIVENAIQIGFAIAKVLPAANLLSDAFDRALFEANTDTVWLWAKEFEDKWMGNTFPRDTYEEDIIDFVRAKFVARRLTNGQAEKVPA